MDGIDRKGGGGVGWGGWGGGGGATPLLFANKMIYITPASLDGLTKNWGGRCRDHGK